MKKLLILLLTLVSAVSMAQITAPSASTTRPTAYTDGSPNDIIYIWCLPANSAAPLAELTCNSPGGGPAPYDFEWFQYNTGTNSYDPYSTQNNVGSSTISNLATGGYSVTVRDNNGDVIGCYRAWVFNNETDVEAGNIATTCGGFTLQGAIDPVADFVYYNPPPDRFVIDATTEITVCFDATHTFFSDIGFYLISPGGTTIPLSPNPGSVGQAGICNAGNDVNNLCFTTESVAQIDPCTHPVPATGTFGGYTGNGGTIIDWSPLFGQDAAQAGWSVQIYDCIGGDVGTLDDASITFIGNSVCGPEQIDYVGNNINSVINDNSCTPASASIYTVPQDPSITTPIVLANNIVSFEWTDDHPCVTIPNPTTDLTPNIAAVPPNSTTFTLEVVDNFGCDITDGLVDDVTFNRNCPCPFNGTNLNVGACDPSDGNYNATGSFSFDETLMPCTGTLTITNSCGGAPVVYNAPFSSPAAYAFNDVLADGTAGCVISATFSDDPAACVEDINAYVEPNCPCGVAVTSINQNLPNCATNEDVTGTVEIIGFPPATGDLIVEDCQGNQEIVASAPFTTGDVFNYALSSLADGNACDITVYFEDQVACEDVLLYNSQLSSGANEAGTFNPGHNGDGTNTPAPATTTYVLCDQDEFTFSHNNDFVIPDISAGTPDPADGYNPGIVYFIYDCPPSPGGPGIWPPADDPCFIGFVNAGDDIIITNIGGAPSTGGTLDADNGYYVVPMSSYDVTGPYFHADCYDLSIDDTYYLQYLNPITFTFTEDCQAGTATITVNGGYPEYYAGEEFTGSNLSHGSFTDNTAEHGQTITISGLTGGDDYSFDVIDQNGCPITINPAGTFPPLLDAAFAYPTDVYCSTDVDPNTQGVTNPGGTYHSIQGGLSINAGNGTIDLSASTGGTYDVVYSTQPLDAVCFDTDTFQVTINMTPVVDDVVNVVECDSYTMPNIGAIDNANNTGTLGFYNGAGGTGGQIAFGSAWTTVGTTTVYIYDETGTVPNCFDEEDFTITINETPVVDDVANQTACDTYTLPAVGAIDNANNTASLGFYNGPNGTGGQLGFGSDITAAGVNTVYIYDETGTTPNCFDQEDFTVTISESVDAGADDGATLCNAAGNQLTLSTLLAGADAGGVWSETTGLPHGGAGVASGAFNPGTSVFDPDGLTPQVYTFMYLLTTTAPCVNDTAFFTINVTGLIDAGADNAITFCNTPGADTDVNDLLDAGVTGGTWSQFSGPATGQFNTGTGILDLSDLVAGDYVFRYTIPASGPCLGDDADMTVTINEIPYIDNPSDETVCDTYTLPAITGTSLTAGVGYYTATNGGGVNLAEGSAVTAAGVNTIYVYDETGTVPNCFEEDTFAITVNITPIVDDIADDILCDTYSLPAAVPGTNLTANAGFFTAPDGGGVQLVNGSDITAAGVNTVYIYDETATTPNCSSEEDFTITINLTPVVDDIADQTGCDSYTLPAVDAIDNANNTATLGFYNGPNGTGGQLAFGSDITAAGVNTVYIYDETGTVPNCFDEEDFTVTISTSVNAGLDNGQQVCNVGGASIDLGADLLDVTADAGGVWSETTGLPHGGAGAPSGAFNPATSVLNAGGLAEGTYTFMYLLSTTAPCVNDTAFFTITVTGLIDAGADNAITFCNTPGTDTDLNDLLDAGVTGGTWSETTAGPSGQFTIASGILDLTDLNAGDYTFNYAIPANGACPGDDADMTVTINEVPYIDNPADVTVCDVYTLPAITGTSLTAGVGYYTATNGGGVNLAVGSDVTTPGANTIYVYDETGTAPNCFEEDTFVVTVNVTPAITDVAVDPIACDTYALPAIAGTDLTGNQAFYTQTNGGGTQMSTGDAITTTQTVYIYDATGTVPNCTHEQDFLVTINITPEVDDILDQEECDTYSLPAGGVTGTNITANAGFFTAPGGGGVQLADGSAITTPGTTTVYIYDETGTAPNCSDEEQFDVVINVTPDVDAVADQAECDSYTLPVIAGSNLSNVGYYTAPDGGGAPLAVGANITAEGTTTVYVYDETNTTPNCTDEESFDVLINITPDVADLADGSYCDDYTLPAITAAAGGVLTGNEAYYTGANGTGTQYNAGDVLNSTITLFIYDATAGPVCSDQEQVNITINNAITAGADNADSICAEGGIVNVGALLDPAADVNPDADAWQETTITGVSGGFDPATQMFDVTGVAPGNYTFEYHVDGVAPCLIAQAEFTIVVHELPDVDAGLYPTPICGGASNIFSGSTNNMSNDPMTYVWDNGVVDGDPYFPAATNTYTVVGTDVYGCQGTDQTTIEVETDPMLIIDPVLSGCAPLQVTFAHNGSLPDIANSVWTLSNGDVFNGNPVSSTFNDEGPYGVTLNITTNNNCNYTYTEPALFNVNVKPIASFTHGPGDYTVTNPVVEFTNQSDHANAYEWTFGDASTTDEEHPIHTYSTDPSTYEVQLVAFGTPGDPNCVDTAVMTVEILDELLFHIPNTFTPDQDDFNETFQPVFISGFDPYDFTLYIFDRWGEILFESHDATVGWDGKYGGKLVQDGTYVWKIDFKETMSDKRHSEVGHVNVLR